MTERYMKEKDVRKLVDILWQCICTPWYPEYRKWFEDKNIDELAAWVHEQVGHRFPVHEAGGLRVSLKSENFETLQPPQHMVDMLTAYKALAMDYKHGLEEIVANQHYSSNRMAELARAYLGEGSEDSREAIDKARRARG